MPLNSENMMDYLGNDKPKCPHCDHEADVGDNDLWHIYEEGEHEIDCPWCNRAFTVSTHVSYSFWTCDQPELEGECDADARG